MHEVHSQDPLAGSLVSREMCPQVLPTCLSAPLFTLGFEHVPEEPWKTHESWASESGGLDGAIATFAEGVDKGPKEMKGAVEDSLESRLLA